MQNWAWGGRDQYVAHNTVTFGAAMFLWTWLKIQRKILVKRKFIWNHIGFHSHIMIQQLTILLVCVILFSQVRVVCPSPSPSPIPETRFCCC